MPAGRMAARADLQIEERASSMTQTSPFAATRRVLSASLMGASFACTQYLDPRDRALAAMSAAE